MNKLPKCPSFERGPLVSENNDLRFKMKTWKQPPESCCWDAGGLAAALKKRSSSNIVLTNNNWSWIGHYRLAPLPCVCLFLFHV